MRSTAIFWVVPGLVGVLGVAVARVIGAKLFPAIVWLLLFFALAAASALWIRMRAERTYRPKRMLEAIQSLAENHDLDIGKLAHDGMGEDILAAIGVLDGSVRSLRRDKRRAEMVLSEIADGIVSVDAEGNITLFNRAAEGLLGAKASRVLGGRLESTDLHPELARLASDCLAARSAMASEIRLPGLPERVIGIRAAPFPETRRGESALLLLHDLSEIRRHEKMQKEFVSNVSHELRTPITAVRATAEALLAGAKNDDELVDRFLNTIIAESDRLSALIYDLMEIAKRESGITRTELSALNLAQVVERAFVTIRPIAEQSEVEVGFDVDEELVVCADEIQLVQLIRNLVDNAVKYTLPGGRVDVIAERLADGVSISVRDTGIGIPHGEVDRIFERFYRVDKARSRRLGGTGLGLAIVKDIVEAHGGRISVETELGKGSTFTVMLPAGSQQ